MRNNMCSKININFKEIDIVQKMIAGKYKQFLTNEGWQLLYQ